MAQPANSSEFCEYFKLAEAFAIDDSAFGYTPSLTEEQHEAREAELSKLLPCGRCDACIGYDASIAEDPPAEWFGGAS